MNHSRLTTLATLARWREFQEKLAGTAYQKMAARQTLAKGAYDEACGEVARVQDRRLALLEEPNLDLGRMQFYSRMEAVAWDRSAEKEGELEQANEAAKAALDALAQARSATQVAEARLERTRVAEELQAGKRTFDQMSELHGANRKGSS